MDYIFNFFREKSPWRDVAIVDMDGHYYLLQVRSILSNNRKEFRKAPISEIPHNLNNSTVKPLLYKACNIEVDGIGELPSEIGLADEDSTKCKYCGKNHPLVAEFGACGSCADKYYGK